MASLNSPLTKLNNPEGPKDMTRFLISTTIIAALVTPAAAQSTTRTQSFYNKNGSFAGQSFTHGNSTSYSDKSGSFSGSAIRHGNSTSFYDRNGHYTGSSINTGPRR
jgi:hypothetical protein